MQDQVLFRLGIDLCFQLGLFPIFFNLIAKEIIIHATTANCLSFGHAVGACTVKLGNKERFDKEQIGVKEPYPVTDC